MADLISRAAARDVINTWGRQKSEKVRMGLLHRDLDAIPAVDAVPVVRCRDCKYYNITGCSAGFGWCENTVVNKGVWDNFYCADGERRDEDAAD